MEGWVAIHRDGEMQRGRPGVKYTELAWVSHSEGLLDISDAQGLQCRRQAWLGDINLGVTNEWLVMTQGPSPFFAAPLYLLGHSELGSLWNTAV